MRIFDSEFGVLNLDVIETTRKDGLILQINSYPISVSATIRADTARKFANALLEAADDLDEPNPNQQTIDIPQQEAA